MNGETKFTASMLTLSGVTFAQMPRWDVPARSDAAARAGFAYVGAWSGEFMNRPDYGRIRSQTAGCPVGELEFYDLSLPDHNVMSDVIMRMADEFSASIVNVGITSAHGNIPRATLASHLREFATRAAQHGLTVAVEPIAFAVWSLDLISYLVRSCSDLPNVGFLWDMFQTSYSVRHSHGAWTYGRTAQMPLAGVQLAGNGSDAMERHLWAGARDQAPMVARRMPVHMSIEITNARMRRMAPTDAARMAMDAGQRIMAMM